MLKQIVKDFSDMAGEIVEGSVCGAMGAGAGTITGFALAGSTAGVGTPVAIGAGMVVGQSVYKGCKSFGIEQEIKDLLNK